MSLIIDALKKTQQLRLNKPGSSPPAGYPSPNRGRGRNSRKQWVVIGVGFISLCTLLLVFFRPASSPLATQTNGAIAPVEKKPFLPIAEKKTPEKPSNEALSLPGDEEPLSADLTLIPASGPTGSSPAAPHEASSSEAAFSSRSSPPVKERVSLVDKSSFNEKNGRSVRKQVPKEQKVRASNKTVEGKAVVPSPSVTQKEEAPSKSIAVEQEGGKDHPLASEVLDRFNSGVTFYNQREFSKAIEAYQRVIELDPGYVEAYNNLGIIYQTMGDVKSALGAYQKATEINPKYVKGYNNLGLLFLLEDRYEEALEAFQKGLAINSNHIESHINLGILFKKKGQWENAVESYQKALAIDPLHRETHYNMALLYEQLENTELAIRHYQQFIQLSSKSYPELVAKVQRHLNTLVEARKSKRP